MSRNSTRAMPAIPLFILLISIPASGCATAHPPHRTVVTYKVHKAPPAAHRDVVVVKSTRGHVWVPGHYVWRPARHDYVWVKGQWSKPPRRGAVWVKPRHEKRHGQVVFVAGYWR